jgi:hypothetical protein
MQSIKLKYRDCTNIWFSVSLSQLRVVAGVCVKRGGVPMTSEAQR